MKRHLLLVGVVSLLSLLTFWAPFMFRLANVGGIQFGASGMATIVQNFDGLNFLVVAKSLYDPRVIEQINTRFLTGNEPIYFAAHYPLLPLVIHLLSFLIPPPQALLVTIVLSNLLLAAALYLFFASIKQSKEIAPLLAMIALFWPARMLSARAVSSNEPLFIALVLTSLVLARHGRDWLAAILGALAVLTRSPGILLFLAYVLSLAKTPRRLLPYLLMPGALLALFGFYGWRYGSPLAYFQSGDNLHLSLLPFQIFSNRESWITGIWREDFVYMYLFYGIGIYLISPMLKLVKNFGYVYALVLLFVSHQDLARYALPLAPMALVGYAPILSRLGRKHYLLLALLLIPIFLLGWQFVLGNVQPINDWGALL